MSRDALRLAAAAGATLLTVLAVVYSWQAPLAIISRGLGVNPGVSGALLAAAAALLVQLGYPMAAWVLAGVGLAAGYQDPIPALILLVASGPLYWAALRLGERVAETSASRAAAAWLPIPLAAAAAAALASKAALALIAVLSTPPEGLPPTLAEPWRALGSTVAGRMLVAGAALLAMLRLSDAAAGQLEGLLLPPRLLAERLRGEARREWLQTLRGRDWSHTLLSRLLYLSLLPLEAAAALAAGVAVAEPLVRLAGTMTAAERVAILAAAAAAAWLAVATIRVAAESLLIRGTGWRRAALAGAALLVAATVAAAYTLGAAEALSLLDPTSQKQPLPWDSWAEERLRAILEGLEDQLRLVVSLLWD